MEYPVQETTQNLTLRWPDIKMGNQIIGPLESRKDGG